MDPYSPSLLFQLLISDLLAHYKAMKKTAQRLPFGLSKDFLHRLREHLSLLALQLPAEHLLMKALQTALASAERPPVEPKLKRIASLLLKLLPLFQSDENVLFFLLKRQNEIDTLLGKKYIRKALLLLRPNDLLEFLEKRYLARGFDHLIAHIHLAMGKTPV